MPTADEAAEAGGDAQPQRFPCGQCGAKLGFKPGTTSLQCPYCGHENAIETSTEKIEELDFHAWASRIGEQETEEHTTVKCDACAAEIDADPIATSFECPFCGSNIVATAHMRRLIKPRGLLPFKTERKEADARYRKWLRSLWFAPNALRRYARLEGRLNGIYVPYWTYDSRTTSRYTGERGEHYYVTVGSGKNRRTVRKTRWYPASGVVRNTFDDVLVLASRSLPRKYADALEPWDLGNLVDYEHAFLSGFRAESYQIELDEGFGIAKRYMDEVIRGTVRADIGGDTQRIHMVHSTFDDLTFKHILLPIWVSAYRYRDKVYRFLVNARTGEVQGERPYSWVKITLAVLGGLAVLAGVWWLVQAMDG